MHIFIKSNPVVQWWILIIKIIMIIYCCISTWMAQHYKSFFRTALFAWSLALFWEQRVVRFFFPLHSLLWMVSLPWYLEVGFACQPKVMLQLLVKCFSFWQPNEVMTVFTNMVTGTRTKIKKLMRSHRLKITITFLWKIVAELKENKVECVADATVIWGRNLCA